MPAWCHSWISALFAGRGTRAGDPLSWRHFKYGLSYLGRNELADTLTLAGAVRSANSPQDEYIAWRSDLKRVIG